ncbi:MAG TPA: hypothetical protein VHY18_06530 [Solirubrobacteraceae bacterium]|jgi:hypothetical protein|nr:hypothetical protein [Solirubrobacteraceae bacterium]
MSVSFDLARPGKRVPGDFLGLSFEAASLAQVARYGERGNLVALLRSLGPGVLRFGGVTSDTQVAWTDAHTPLPAWASQGLDEHQLDELRVLAARSGWRVLLTIGLAHFQPRAAAREAAAAKRALGAWLAGIELGNEPDTYARHGFRTQPWTFAHYEAQVSAYRRAIDAVAPGLALVGPDASGSLVFENWARDATARYRPSMLTGHHYPLGCHNIPAPTITRLLSPKIRRAEETSLHRYLRAAHRAHLPFRLDEANTVSCGGQAGISDRFASALWAIDYIAHTMTAGAAGINLQANPSKCTGYTPLCATSTRALADGALTPHPEWYALLMARLLLGSRPVRATVSTTTPADVDALAFLAPDGVLRVLAVDDEPPGARHVKLRLRLPRRYRRTGTLALSAPSPSAASGVHLDGETNGQRRARAAAKLPADSESTTSVDLAPSTATMVAVTP